MKEKSSASITGTLIQLTFIVLKLCKVIDWSWWWVLSPLWISTGLVLIILIVGFILRKGWKS